MVSSGRHRNRIGLESLGEDRDPLHVTLGKLTGRKEGREEDGRNLSHY